MATFTKRVTTITQNTILPKMFDNLLGGNFITFRVMSNAKKWSGVTLDRPVKLRKSSLGGSYSGLDTHNTGTVEDRETMSFDPRGYEMPVGIAGMDRAVNATPARIINLLKIEMESRADDALDDLGDILYGDGTGNNNKDFLGLDVLDDDGTSVDSIGGLSRASYPQLKGTRTASGGLLTMAKISTLISTVSTGSSSRLRPTVFISDDTVWDLGESLLTPTVRSNYEMFGMPTVTRTSRGPIRQAQNTAIAGYTSIIVKGIPWIADEKSTSQTLWAVNENYLEWYGLRDPDLKPITLGSGTIDGPYAEVPSKNVGFQWTGFLRPINQHGTVGHLYILGNFVTFRPKSHGRLTGITGV